jgi:hypothetical protein
VIEELKRRRAEDLCILGGTVNEADLPLLMSAFKVDGNWSICEYPDRYQILVGKPTDTTHLERWRHFGPTGDLDVRLDDGVYYWRFIGKPGEFKTDGLASRDFWEHNPSVPHLAERNITLYLWGENRDGQFYEAKVARANLDYPVDAEARRAVIRARVYTYMGRQQFAWYTGLEGWK